MGRKAKPADATTADRHKPGFLVRIPEAYRAPLAEMVKETPGTDRTDFVRQAVKEFLEKNGRWPIAKKT